MDTTTRQETTMIDPAMLIDYHAGQAAYSATVKTRADLRRRIMARTRQTRFNAALGLRTLRHSA